MTDGLNKIALLASADLTAAEVALRGIPNDDPGGTFSAVVAGLLREGKASLAEIVANGERVGFTVYQIETFAGNHRELVSVATVCEGTRNLKFEIEHSLEAIARANGCRSIRMHTARHGLVKLALNNGWHTAEIVLRKSIH